MAELDITQPKQTPAYSSRATSVGGGDDNSGKRLASATDEARALAGEFKAF